MEGFKMNDQRVLYYSLKYNVIVCLISRMTLYVLYYSITELKIAFHNACSRVYFAHYSYLLDIGIPCTKNIKNVQYVPGAKS